MLLFLINNMKSKTDLHKIYYIKKHHIVKFSVINQRPSGPVSVRSNFIDHFLLRVR